MSWSTAAVDEIFSSLDTSPDGLSQSEAKKRLKEYGKNRLNPEINGSFGFKFVAKLLEPNISLLLTVSTISAVSTVLNNEYPYELLVIMAIIVLNAGFTVFRRSQADRFMQDSADKTMAYISVLRDYEETEVPESELVPGDIIFLSKGCTVPADCRIYKSESLSVEESAIRGLNSEQIHKYSTQLLGITDEELDFKDMNNMLFKGSTVISGECTAIVTATGLSTYLGKNNDIVSTFRKNKTPLQLKLYDANNQINIVAMILCGFVLFGQLVMLKLSGETIHFDDTMNKIMIALALSITTMPQGLAQSAGIIISNVSENLASKNVIIKNCEKAEVLGSSQVVITDLRYIPDYTVKDVSEYVKSNTEAGIITVLLTDSDKKNIIKLYEKTGVTQRKSQYISADELNGLNEEDYTKQFREYLFYCSVTDEEKTRIIKKWTSEGYTTVSTGNGITDILAVKNAVASIQTTDNNKNIRSVPCDISIKGNPFNALTSAIESGRRIFFNIRKLFIYTVTNSLASLLTVLIATVLKFNILTTVQLLWINLITDTLPSVALSLDGFENDLMKRKPYKTPDDLYNKDLWLRILKNGIIITLLTLLSYFIGEVYHTGVWRFVWVTDENGAIGTTMAFITMSLSGLFNALNMRSDRVSLLITEKAENRNPLLYLTNILAIGLSVIAVRVPLIADIFGFVRISWLQYGTAIAIAFMIIPISEAVKYIKKKRKDIV